MIDTAMIYPICCHWGWHPDGIFYNYIVDFSGSSIVHMCGGASALAGEMTEFYFDVFTLSFPGVISYFHLTV